MSRTQQPLDASPQRRRKDGRPYLARRESTDQTRWISPNSKHIAWAAGAYEGEGCVVLRGKSRVSPTVTLGQKNWWLPFELRTYFGGRVHYKPKDEYYVWQIHGARAIGFLQTIYMFLSPRRQERIREVLTAWQQ